tara:strand:+ start:4711 stop:5160 length:450 start_codon:yes stop_codon:yes gene_type:complete
MSEELRKTPDGRFVYPWPIVKGQKYLIACQCERAAHYLILLFELGLLVSPPPFESIPHSDGTTPLYQIPEDGPVVAFLPKRSTDPSAALGIETVLSKAMWRFVKSEEVDDANKLALEKRFAAQLACSSCQGLGIGEESVARLVERVLEI